MAIDGYQNRIWQPGANYNGIPTHGNGNRTPEVPVHGSRGAQRGSSNTNYDKEIDNAYKNGGSQGLLDYLDTLNEGVVSNLKSEKDAAKGLWTVTFTIAGKNYKFVENWAPNSPSGTQNAPAVSGQTTTDDYASILDKIANESGLEGIKEYLNNLDDGVVTYINTCKNPENYYPRKEYLFFTLNGKNYIYEENLDTKQQLQEYYDKLEELRENYRNYGKDFSIEELEKLCPKPSYLQNIQSVTKRVTDNSQQIINDYIIPAIYEQGGLQGLFEYLDSLEDGVLESPPQWSRNVDTGETTVHFRVSDSGCKPFKQTSFSFPAEQVGNANQTSKSSESYLTTINNIFSKDGIQGLLDYIKTLDKDVISSINCGPFVDGNGNSHWFLNFTINGTKYSFTESSKEWDFYHHDLSDEEMRKLDAQVQAALDLNNYDLKDLQEKSYSVDEKTGKVDLDEIKKDLEKINIKEQIKEQFKIKFSRKIQMLNYNTDKYSNIPEVDSEMLDLIIEKAFDNALAMTLDDLRITYVTNGNGEKVPYVRLEDIIDKLIINIATENYNNANKTYSTIPLVNGQEMYEAEPVTYEYHEFESKSTEEFELKREKMKDFMMSLKAQYAKSYGVVAQNIAIFEALFEECVNAVLNDLTAEFDPNGSGMIMYLNGVERYKKNVIDTPDLVKRLNQKLGKRIDNDTLQKLSHTDEELQQQREEAQRWQERQRHQRITDYIKEHNINFRTIN